MDIRCPVCGKFLMSIDPAAGVRAQIETVCRRCPKDKKTGETAKIRITFPHPLGSEWVPIVEQV